MNVKDVKTVGTIHYVPPAVFKGWDDQFKVDYVKAQSELGYSIKLEEFIPVDLTDPISIRTFYYKHKENFSAVLTEQLQLKDSTVADDVYNTYRALICATDRLRLATLEASGYTRGSVPESFNVLDEFVITNRKIRRKSTSESSDLFVCASDFKALFNLAYAYWKDGQNIPSGRFILRTGGRHSLECNSTAFKIGCQTIQRYEMEAVAIELGFAGYPFKL